MLSPAARVKYDKAIALSMYGSFEIKDINVAAVSDSLGLLTVSQSLYPVQNFVFSSRRVEYFDAQNYTWNGEFLSDETDPSALDYASIAVIVKGGIAFGQINLDGEIIDFTSLEGKTVLLCKQRLSFDAHIECNQPNFIEQVQNNLEKSINCDNSIIRVLVAFNQAASDDVIDINETATIAVNQTNTVLSNSGLSMFSGKVVLAGTVLTPIVLTNSLELKPQVENIFGGLSAARNTQQADIIMFLVGNNELDPFSIFGQAANIPANFNESWVIQEISISTSNRRTFAHELFHLLGCFHDNATTTIAGNSRAHSFNTGIWPFLRKRCSIVTAGSTAGGCFQGSRIEYLSSPGVSFKNKKTGTSTRNNKQAVSNNFSEVAGFYPDPNLNLHWLNITDPTCSNSYVLTATATANTPCLIPPIKYKWRSSPNGINFTDWANISFVTSSTHQFFLTQPTPPATSSTKYVQCLAQDANGFVAIMSGQGTYYCSSNVGGGQDEGGSALMSNLTLLDEPQINVYPNPVADGVLFIEMLAVKEGRVRMDVFDLAGRLVDQSGFSIFQNEDSNFYYECIDLKPGSYSFVFRLENESPICHHVIINR